MKNPMTPAGIEPETYRFVAQHLNHSATAVSNNSNVADALICVSSMLAIWNVLQIIAVLTMSIIWVSVLKKITASVVDVKRAEHRFLCFSFFLSLCRFKQYFKQHYASAYYTAFPALSATPNRKLSYNFRTSFCML